MEEEIQFYKNVPAGNVLNDMEIEEEDQIESYGYNGQGNTGIINEEAQEDFFSEEAEDIISEEDQGEPESIEDEEPSIDSDSYKAADYENSPSSPSALNWIELEEALPEGQAAIPNRDEISAEDDEYIEEQHQSPPLQIPQQNMMALIGNWVDQARSDRTEPSVSGLMDLSDIVRPFQAPLEYNRDPFASSTSHRRIFGIPPLRGEDREESPERGFPSTNRRPPRPRLPDRSIPEDMPGPPNSPASEFE
ncbi:hypothetical protein TWF481_003165 [Arthrobotrys musiformis]|uniref:Uncharacterized protein n=1 Tax=Arthrobotrys musiformis TaxID=47236 RepID=A0AAV9VQN9_9PEZI